METICKFRLRPDLTEPGTFSRVLGLVTLGLILRHRGKEGKAGMSAPKAKNKYPNILFEDGVCVVPVCFHTDSFPPGTGGSPVALSPRCSVWGSSWP